MATTERLQVNDQLRTAQDQPNVRVEAMGHSLGEMNDLLFQRELRVETQIYDLSNQMSSVLNAVDALRREKLFPRSGVGVPAESSSASTSVKPNLVKPNPASTVNPNLTRMMKPSTSRPTSRGKDQGPRACHA